MRDSRALVRRAFAAFAIGAMALLLAAPARADIAIISVSPLPDAALGSEYSFQFRARSTVNKYPQRWYALDKSCFGDTGLYVSSDGILAGIASKAGVFDCAVGVSQYNGDGTYQDKKTFHLEVKSAAVPPTITSTCPEAAVFGKPYSKSITVAGTEPIAITVSGLPPALTFDPVTRQITGTPQVSGDFPLVIGAKGQAPPDASQNCTLKVARTPPVFTFTVKPDPAVEGQPVVATATLAGGDPAPTGSVQFWAASSVERCPAPFEPGPLPVTANTQTISLAGGEAKATFNALIAGNYHACAEYKGDAVYDPARAGPVDLFVIKGVLLSAPKLTLSAPPSIAAGGVLSPRIVVSGDGGRVPSGRVTLHANGREIGSAQLENGAAYVSMTAPVAGQVTLSATYFGDGAYAPGVSDALLVVVAKAAPVEAVPTLSQAFLALLALLLAALAMPRLVRRRAR